jgi:3-phenylpropionate/cinnamic acid dioxygenase small subunit
MEAILKVQALYSRHAQLICDDELESWPALYTENCLYRVTSRVNHERKLPIGIILAESRGALHDRVTSMRKTMVYAPRWVTHLVSNAAITHEQPGLLQTRSHFAVYYTQVDGNAKLQLVGRTFDEVDTTGENWLFSQRCVVYDNELIPGSVVHPI